AAGSSSRSLHAHGADVQYTSPPLWNGPHQTRHPKRSSSVGGKEPRPERHAVQPLESDCCETNRLRIDVAAARVWFCGAHVCFLYETSGSPAPQNASRSIW